MCRPGRHRLLGAGRQRADPAAHDRAPPRDARPVSSCNDDYQADVRNYRSGNAEAAVRRLARLDREQLQTGLTAFTSRVLEEDRSNNPASVPETASLITAAAAVHTEAALRTRVPMAADLIEIHLRIATSIVDDGVPVISTRVGPARPNPTVVHRVTPEFRRLWYLAVITAMQRLGRIERAASLLEQARMLFPQDAEILLLSGIADEIRTTQRLVTVDANERQAALTRAESDLRASLAIAPDLMEARLRLGRVLQQQGKIPEARVLLTRVASAEDGRQVYLASLFLGRLEDGAGQPRAAADWYDKAAARIPSGQAAKIAASELRHRAGDRQRAIDDLQSAIGSQESDDPWWMYLLRRALETRSAAGRSPRDEPVMKMRQLLWSIALASIVCLPADAQQPFRSGVDVVRVDALVTDGHRPIAGLKAADFELLDNGVPQQIDSVALDSQPLAVVLVLDTSGSVAGNKMAHLAAAVGVLLKGLRPADRAALVTFSHRLWLPAPLSSNLGQIRAMLANVTAQGGTALNDAVYAGMALSDTADSKPLVLVFSDGIDNASWLEADAVESAARRADAVVDGVAVGARIISDTRTDGSPAREPSISPTRPPSSMRSRRPLEDG